MRLMAFAFVVVACASVFDARAENVSVQVRTPDGEPVSNAVVSIVPSKHVEIPNSQKLLEIRQSDLKFDPYVLVAPVGARVRFPNLDRVQHHIYSFSKAKSFEIQLYSHDVAPSETFPEAGVVAIGCNIHDRMSAYIYVTAAPFAGKTDASGLISFSGVPAGSASIRAWHFRSALQSQEVVQVADIAEASGASLTVTVELRPMRKVKHGNY